MRHHVNIVLGAFTTAVVLFPSSSTIAQTNWREVRSLKMGRFFTRVDVSSRHTLRVYAQLDTSKLMGDQLTADSVRTLHQQLFDDLDKQTRTQYMRGNTMKVQQYA